MDETSREYEQGFILSMYEEGKPVSEIAKKLKKTEAYVYAQMRQQPETYEDLKRVREEKYQLTLRRVRGLADKITLEYLERLNERLQDEKTTDEEKEKIFAEIDRVQKIGRQYADRVLLAEGKTTQNIGISKNDIPIEVVIHKTYEGRDDEPAGTTSED
jgi:uncharacterized protein involved in type VI secretion and phage assembly